MELGIRSTNSYSGNVEVIAYKDGVEYDRVMTHNKGTVALCAYIAECLRGANVVANRPGYLTPLVYSGPQDTEGTEMFSYGIMYSGMSDVTTDSLGDYASYTLTFIIPSTVLLGVDKLEGLMLKGLNKVEYARVKLSNAITVVSNTNIKVNWTLKVSNVASTGEV